MSTRSSFALLLALVVLPLGCGGDDSAGNGGSESGADADPFERERDELESGDETLTSGEFADSHTFNADAGQWIEVAMTSAAFDPYVILRPPSCDDGGTCDAQVDNDDFLPNNGAFIWHQAGEGGRWTILATSHAPGESGAYEVAYRVVDAGEQPATAGVALGSGRTERGQLQTGDETLSSGEFSDGYGFVGRAGDRVTLDLRSSAFDPYLILQMPDDRPQLDNDDHEGSREHARIEATLPADGMYRILVTSYAAGQQGAYDLQITPGGSGGTAPPPDEGSGKPPAGGGSGGGEDPFTKG